MGVGLLCVGWVISAVVAGGVVLARLADGERLGPSDAALAAWAGVFVGMLLGVNAR